MDRKVIRFFPTSIGLAAILAAFLVALMADNQRMAVGFFVALAILAVVDVVAARVELERRPVSVRLITSTVASPDRFPFSVQAPPGALALDVRVPLLSPTTTPAPRYLVPSDGSAVRIEMEDSNPDVQFGFRVGVSTSWLGLVSVTQWWGVRVPGGMWRGLRPGRRGIDQPPAVDELARLREYLPGDRMSRVSWPTTARTGQLHVRAAGVDATEVVLRVELGSLTEADHERWNQILQLATDIAAPLLEQGHVIRLVGRVVDERYQRELVDWMMKYPHRPVTFPGVVDGERLFTRGGELVNGEVRSTVVTTIDGLHRAIATVNPGEPLPAPTQACIQVDRDGARVVR